MMTPKGKGTEYNIKRGGGLGAEKMKSPSPHHPGHMPSFGQAPQFRGGPPHAYHSSKAHSFAHNTSGMGLRPTYRPSRPLLPNEPLYPFYSPNQLKQSTNYLTAHPVYPSLDGGCYSFACPQRLAVQQFHSFAEFYQSQIQKLRFHQAPADGGERTMTTMGLGEDEMKRSEVIMNSVSIEIVGTMISDQNSFCYVITCLLSLCLIFPMFFMSCQWWQKIAYPCYTIREETYVALAQFLSSVPSVTRLTLQITDNNFTSKKADIISSVLRGRPIQQFNLVNKAQPFEYQQDQYDRFEPNCESLRHLGNNCYFQWDTMMF